VASARVHRGAALLLLYLGLTACTVVGPDYQAPPAPALPSAWEPARAQEQARSVGAWWQRFNDPVLDELIARSARQNLSIEAAGLRIVQARAALGISDALVFPQQQQINANYSGLYRDEDWFKSASASLDVGWEMDIWGKYARGIESAEATLYASIASYHDVLVSITAEVARNYINYRTAEERMFLARQNIAIQERVVEMTRVQYESGNVSELDVQQARTQLYATQASLPGLNNARQQSLNAIAVLLGTVPETIAPLLEATGERPLPRLQTADGVAQRSGLQDVNYQQGSVIPAAPVLEPRIDSALVLQRPDLQVAELLARAQSAQIGLNEANLYPQFVLFGSVGASQTVRSSRSFDFDDAVTASIGPGLSWDIFNYDRIKNRVRIEDAAFQESLANYNQSVLEAVREVSNALEGYQNNLERSGFDHKAVEASIRAFNISANQYNNGLVTYQRLLSTVEKMTAREDIYAQTRGAIANQLVALYKALGGGWDTLQTGPVVKPDTVRQMRERTDWGDYLDPETIVGEDRNE
tara:strand:+ start:1253 stop:2839 length:1587 start_codon:yes stop_codon:yes gene_type:complete